MNRLRTAFTLMEVNLAIFIMAAGVLGLVSLYSLGFRENSQSQEDVAVAGLADVFLAPMVAKLSDTNLTWTAWCNAVPQVGSSNSEYDGLSPENGWADYVERLNDKSDLNAYRVKGSCKTTANSVVGKIIGAQLSGSRFSYPSPSGGRYVYGLVATRKGPTISLAFRASRRPQALLGQPVYYTEVHFQGKADE